MSCRVDDARPCSINPKDQRVQVYDIGAAAVSPGADVVIMSLNLMSEPSLFVFSKIEE